MSQPTSAPPVLPLPAEGAAPAPVAPSPAASPETPVVPQGTIEPVSTATITEGVAKQLRGMIGAKPQNADSTAKPSGPEPSPEGGADSGQPSDAANPAATTDDDDTTPAHEGQFSPGAIAALAEERGKRRELKTELKAKDQTIQQLQDTLKQFNDRMAALEGKGSTPDGKPNGKPPSKPGDRTSGPKPPALVEAEEAEANVRGTAAFAAQHLREFNRALRSGADTTPLLERLNAELAAHDIPAQADAEAAQDWLETLRDNASKQLTQAMVTTQLLRHELAQDHGAIRAESEQLAALWLPEAKDAAKPQAQKLAKLKGTFPELEAHPLGARFLAAAVRGWEVIEREEAAKGKTNGHARTATATTPPGRPVPALPGPSSALPPRQNGSVLGDSSAAFKRMEEAKSPEEFAQAKEAWMKTLANNTALAGAR